MDIDKTYINIALFTLKQIIGRTFPNPPVVSIIVESNKTFTDNKIVSFGITSITGRPHAEANAINSFRKKKSRIYTLYSTLEPCCHKGRSESCVSKIISSGFINRVIFCTLDPDLRVNGKGKKDLIDNNIIVKSGLMKDQAFKIYEGYFLNRILKRPKVILKLALSIDGFISLKKNIRSKITNKMTNHYAQILRSEVDGILVGSNTVKVDDCILNCRSPGLRKFSPIRIILNRDLDLNLNSKIFKKCNQQRTIIFSHTKDEKKCRKYLNKNVEVRFIEPKKYNLKNILNDLSSIGICNLLVEGGAQIFSSFIKEDLFDEIFLFRVNFFIGDGGLNAIKVEKDYMLSKKKFSIQQIKRFGDDSLEILNLAKKSYHLKEQYVFRNN